MAKKILVADDDTSLTKIIKDFLVKKDCEVDLACNGQEMLSLIKNNQYEIIFTDFNMPDLTGLELVQYIKQNKLGGKIVMFTGYPEMSEFFAKTIGVDVFLKKPVNVDDLLKQLEVFIK